MKEKIIWILIALMAAAFLYLKIKQAAVGDSPSVIESAPPVVSTESRGHGASGEISDAGNMGGEEIAASSDRGRSPRNDVFEESTGIVRIGGTQISVEIASTDAARAQGLSGRPALAEDRGMLFIMDKADRHYFWMKAMLFPIDIIWIRQGRVVDISADIAPPQTDEAPLVVRPDEPADQVLEVNAGFAEASGIQIGAAAVMSR